MLPGVPPQVPGTVLGRRLLLEGALDHHSMLLVCLSFQFGSSETLTGPKVSVYLTVEQIVPATPESKLRYITA